MFHIVIGLVLVAVVRNAAAFKSGLHPFCETGGLTLFNDLEDITSLLHGNGILPPETCVFNPAVLHLRGDLFLWAARTCTQAKLHLRCVSSVEQFLYPVAYDFGGGADSKALVFAVTRTTRNAQGRLTHELMGFRELRGTQLEDPRLFQAASGSVWMLAFFRIPAGLQTVTLLEVRCGDDSGTGSSSGGGGGGGGNSGLRCQIWVGGTRMLWYTESLQREKNWVPHNGTTRMSYPHYPSFGPHSGFEWGSYREPAIKTHFDFHAPLEYFFTAVTAFYRGLVEFSGSTPAILHDDGQSYIAAGHIRANPRCFHDMNGPAVSGTCAAMAEVTKGTPVQKISFFNFSLPGSNAGKYPHHGTEYVMFFYRFSATPPHEITHISHAFMPCSFYHYGITYPSGLTRIGPNRDFLLSYGEADRYSRVLTITAANMDRLLVPMDQMRSAVKSYTLCTMPCPT